MYEANVGIDRARPRCGHRRRRCRGSSTISTVNVFGNTHGEVRRRDVPARPRARASSATTTRPSTCAHVAAERGSRPARRSSSSQPGTVYGAERPFGVRCAAPGAPTTARCRYIGVRGPRESRRSMSTTWRRGIVAALDRGRIGRGVRPGGENHDGSARRWPSARAPAATGCRARPCRRASCGSAARLLPEGGACRRCRRTSREVVAVVGRRDLLGEQRQGDGRARLRARATWRPASATRSGRPDASGRRTLRPWRATSRCSSRPAARHRPEMPTDRPRRWPGRPPGGGRHDRPAPPPGLDPRPDAVGRQLPRAQGAAPRPRPQHGLRGGPLPEHRGVLGPAHGHDHDPRRHLHPGLRVLRRQDRPPDLVRRRRAAPRRRGDRRARSRARRRHLGRPRRPARRRVERLRRDDHRGCARPRPGWASRS